MSSKRELHSFLASERFAPAILSSERIVSSALTSAGLTKAGWRTGLLGETLVRHRLFKGQLPETLKSLYEHPELACLREAFEKGETEAEGVDSEVFSYLDDRTESFDRADGLIALLHESDDEAIPVPFTLHENGMDEGMIDASSPPQKLELWKDYLLELDLPQVRLVRLRAPLGPYADKIKGRSLMLPVYLATISKYNPFAPKALQFLATGDVLNDRILPIDGLNEKIRLCELMQADFVGVGASHAKSFPPEEGENLKEFVDRWKKRSRSLSSESLSPAKALEIVREWERKLQLRSVGSREVVEILEFALERIRESDDEDDLSEAWRAHFCLGTAYNHLGEADLAQRHLDQSLRILEGHPSKEKTRALCSISVSFADKGDLKRAEDFAMRSVEVVSELRAVDSFDLKVARISSLGCLGAQVLMHQGLWDENKKSQSSDRLRKALDEARSLYESALDAGRDVDLARANLRQSLGQRFWWFALFDQDKFFVEFDSLADEPEGRDPYLERGRWLACFRAFLIGRASFPDDWKSWSLPKPNREDEDWLLALSLKYRGFLFALEGNVENAKTDFDRAVELLRWPDGGWIIDYLRATVSAVAAVCLESSDEGPAFGETALDEFSQLQKNGFYSKHPEASPAHWIRFLNLSSGRKLDDSPQRRIPY